MAVNNIPKTANQFWPDFIKKKTYLIILVQALISVVFGTILASTGIITTNPAVLWALVCLLFLLSTAINIFMLNNVTRPTKDLVAALLSVSGEKTLLTPPNPNTSSNEKSGLRDALQIIYKLSTDRDKKSDKNTADQTARSILNTTRCGFIALDSSNKIIYSNKNAPTHINSRNEGVIDLIFNDYDNLESWLEKCDNSAIKADRVWARIPDKMPNQDDRRFFDVYASYQKESKFTTVLTLIDRTENYITDEESLDFISFAAHELRGPITVIRGYLDVLQDELADSLKGDQQELFHRLVVSSNRLSGYIDNILNTSKYDRRHLKLNLSEDSIVKIYDTISDDMSLRASTQNRLLTVAIPDDLPTIAADRGSISEVLGNLIDNAIKYSNEGGVINVSAKKSGGFVEVSVQDSGIGMPESVVSNLFQKFYRSHRSRETVAGTGIGLYISKAIVESHGGKISVASEDGRGSTFTVFLPIYATVEDKLKASNSSNEGLISEGNGWIKNHSMYRS